MRQKNFGQGFRKQTHLSHRNTPPAPIEEPLRAYLTFARKLGRGFARLFGRSQNQFEDLIRRIHTVTNTNNVSDISKHYVCYHPNASPVTSCL